MLICQVISATHVKLFKNRLMMINAHLPHPYFSGHTYQGPSSSSWPVDNSEPIHHFTENNTTLSERGNGNCDNAVEGSKSYAGIAVLAKPLQS